MYFYFSLKIPSFFLLTEHVQHFEYLFLDTCQIYLNFLNRNLFFFLKCVLFRGYLSALYTDTVFDSISTLFFFCIIDNFDFQVDRYVMIVVQIRYSLSLSLSVFAILVAIVILVPLVIWIFKQYHKWSIDIIHCCK